MSLMGVLGRLCAFLGRLGAFCGRLGAFWGRLGASWCVLGSLVGPLFFNTDYVMSRWSVHLPALLYRFISIHYTEVLGVKQWGK